MQTELFTFQTLEAAAQCIRSGELVAFPTETVYGLGANAFDEQAVKKVYQVKGRPSDNPLIVHVSDEAMLRSFIASWPPLASLLIEAFWPGPLTLIFPVKKNCFPSQVTGGLATVGVRMPQNNCALTLIQKANVPLVGPSANTSGKPSPTTAAHVYHDLHGKIAGIIDDGSTAIGIESTVLDLTGALPCVLRPGAVTIEQLEAVIGQVTVDAHLLHEQQAPKAPGMKYKHYAPNAQVLIVENTQASWQRALQWAQKQSEAVGFFISQDLRPFLPKDCLFFSFGENTVEQATKYLFAGLRALDEQATLILVPAFSEKGLGVAYMNRLKKAANQTFLEY